MTFKLGRVVLEFDGDKAKLDAALTAAGVKVRQFKKDASGADDAVVGIGKNLATMGRLIGISFTATAVTAFTKKVFDSASAINDQAKAIGFGVEEFQRYSFAAKQSGASQESFVRAAGILNDKLAGGDKSTVAALQKAGLQYEAIRAMKPDQAFLAVSDAVGKIEDPMLRANVAQDLFGKGARELLPGMIEGYKKLGDAATVMSEDTIRRLEAAQDAWEELGNRVVVVSGEMVGQLLRDWDSAKQGYATWWAHINAIAKDGLEGNRRFLAELGDQNFAKRIAAEAKERPFDKFDLIGKPLTPAQVAALGGRAAGPDQDMVKRLRDAEGLLRNLTGAQIAQLKAAQQLADEFETLAKQYGLTDDAQKLFSGHARDLEKAIKDQADAAAELAALHDRLLGKDIIERANKMAAAIGDTVDVTQLLPALQEEVFRTMSEALTVYEELGRVAPDALEDIHDRLLPLTAAQRAFTQEVRDSVDEVARLVNEFQRPTFVVEEFGDFVKDAVDDVAGQINKKLVDDGSFLERLGPTVLQAITGGGGATRSIGALAGQEIGQSLTRRFGETVKRSLGQRLGGIVGGLLPGIGTVLGPLIGSAISGIGRLFGIGPSELEKVQAARAEWLKAQGGLEKLQKALGAVAGDPRVRAAWNDLFNARRLKDYEAALERFNTTVAETQEAINRRLGEEQEARDFLQATLEKYNFSLADMGEKWRQQSITDQASLLVREFTALVASGVDVSIATQHMRENLQAFLITALQTGAEVPEQLRPILQRMIDWGELVDENGNKLTDLSRVNWSKTLTENIQAVIEKLDELIRAITGKLGKAIEEIPPLEIPVIEPHDKAFGRRQVAGVPSFASEAFVRRPTMALVGDVPGGEFVLTPETVSSWMGRAYASGRASSDAAIRELAAAVRRLEAAPRGMTVNISAIDGADVQRFVESRDFADAFDRAARLNTTSLATTLRQVGGA